MKKILTKTQTYNILKALEHQPKKKWGQNFLIEKKVVEKALKMAEIKADDRIVEVGPGLGTLTGALLEHGAHVYGVERDAALVNYLKDVLGEEYGKRLNLMEGDAVEHPLGELPQSTAARGYKILANLPYAITSPWLEKVLEGSLPTRMVLWMQKEAGDRLMASPGSKAFGAIALFLQSAFEVTAKHKVSRHCFYPEPKVDSWLLAFKKKKRVFIFKKETKALIRQFFTQRRKQIQSLCREREDAGLNTWLEYLKSRNMALTVRPEAIPLEAWQELDAFLIPNLG